MPVWLPDALHAENPSTHWPLGTVSGESSPSLCKDTAFGGLTLEVDSQDFVPDGRLPCWWGDTAEFAPCYSLNIFLKIKVTGGNLFIGVNVALLEVQSFPIK